MILIADSGSTKCDWVLADSANDIRVSTEGINPFFCNEQQMEEIVEKHLVSKISQYTVDKIYFFGAGCRDDKKQIVLNVLSRFFSNATVEIDSDLKGAAIALFGNRSGIASIIGTGSISCVYDGTKIIESISPLGYVLGDEGSGAVLGKKFLGDCFKNQIPAKLKKRFLTKYPLTIAELIDKTYCRPFANRFLASFTPFLKDNISDPYVYNLVFDSFTEFFTRNILQYDKYADYEVSFCGSIAYYFADVLEVAAYENGINFGKIIKSPIEGLLEYYRQ